MDIKWKEVNKTVDGKEKSKIFFKSQKFCALRPSFLTALSSVQFNLN